MSRKRKSKPKPPEHFTTNLTLFGIISLMSILGSIVTIFFIQITHFIDLGTAGWFQNLFTWGGYHIHLGLVGFIAVMVGLFVLMFANRKRTRLIAFCIFLVIAGTVAMLWDWEDVLNLNFLSGEIS
jgi:hypothetical protein